MPSAPVRRLGPGDETVAEDACRCFGLGGDLDTRSFLSRPDTTLMVVEVDGRVAGWIYGHELAHPDGERTMLLYALDVADRHRGRGYGSALVRAFVGDARDRGCTEVWALTEHDNVAATATYLSAGGTPGRSAPVMFTWKLAEGRHS
jgi:ribosomal protein S18 acetylase RimI-like enzyme